MLLLPAKVTAREAIDTRRLLLQALKAEPSGDVIVDAGNLQQFDSSALAVLLECRRGAEAAGKQFAVQRAPDKLGSLARLYGVEVLLMPGVPAGATATAPAEMTASTTVNTQADASAIAQAFASARGAPPP